MTRSRNDPGKDAGPFLFDLPLDTERERTEPAAPPARRERQAPEPLAPRVTAEKGHLDRRPDRGAESRPAAVPRAAEPAPVAKSGRRGRFAAGLADLVVHGALVVVAAAGAQLLGAQPNLADWPAFAALLLTFSFLYTVLPLAFWGQTLGMAWAGLGSRSRSGEPLTFDQAARRWLGALLTAGTLGIPLLVAGERSLSDLVSGSGTYPAD
jgi:uncharacterized RDD family membrane protein YckC